MFLIELVTAIIIALFFSMVLVFALGWERPGQTGIFPTILYLFFIIFLFTWAGGIWLTPMGPRTWNVQWLPFFIVGFIITLMLITLVPPKKRRDDSNIRLARRNREQRINQETARALNIFFWILMIILLVTIAVRYLILKPVI